MNPKSSWRWTGVWAGVLLMAILVLQYLGGWYAVQVAQYSKEDELGSHLADLARVASVQLQEPVQAMAQLEQDSMWTGSDGVSRTPDPELYAMGLDRELTLPVFNLMLKARLERVVVISTAGRVLYDTSDPNAILRPFEYARLDESEISGALAGMAEASPAYRAGDLPFKRFYLPIYTMRNLNLEDAAAGEARDTPPPAKVAASEPAVQALVCLVAGRTYLSQIEKLSDTLSRAGMVWTLLIALIGVLIFRLLRRQQLIERQVAEADRLASMGTLAAGFAHELRNPLGIMRAYTEDLEHGLIGAGADEESLGACREIVEEIERMDHLVGQFLDATRGVHAAGEPEAAPVLAVAQGVMSMLRSAAERHGVALELDIPAEQGQVPAKWRARIGSARLRQVMMNLLLNAIQASPQGGRVWLQVEAAPRQLSIKVKDEGPGIPAQIAARIFEPFFTTRPGGAGLGLAVSHQIAIAAGGTLTLANPGVGRGTCLDLVLPRSEDGPPLNHISIDPRRAVAREAVEAERNDGEDGE
ncbi:MAG: ATP-binding protein [Candidatus Sumerlaeia bacterium]